MTRGGRYAVRETLVGLRDSKVGLEERTSQDSRRTDDRRQAPSRAPIAGERKARVFLPAAALMRWVGGGGGGGRCNAVDAFKLKAVEKTQASPGKAGGRRRHRRC